ncbi:MAG: glycosyltransferase [bacterium]|nr:glycosyltransferase [bacterium]
MGIKERIKQVLTEKEDRRYGRLLAERQRTYEAWLAGQEKLWAEENGEDRGEPDKAGSVARQGQGRVSEEFVLIQSCDGTVAPWASKNIERYFKENPEVLVVYCDEDVRTAEGEPGFPWFKPDWSPDFLDSCLYFGGLTAVRRSLWEEMKSLYGSAGSGERQTCFEKKENGRYFVINREAYEEWLHLCVEDGYKRGSVSIGHIPQILFHAESREEQERFLEESDYLRRKRRGLLEDFCGRYTGAARTDEAQADSRGEDGEQPNGSQADRPQEGRRSADGAQTGGWQAGEPAVSVVIPSKDHPDLLRQCVESVKVSGEGIPLEIIVVDNGSGADNREMIEKMLREEAGDGAGSSTGGNSLSIQYMYQPMAFHFSRMCNLGAERARGELLLFLNDDVILRDACIREMAARASRDYTGAVGLKLLYPETERIQHAGITNLPMGPVHKLQSLRDDRDYYGKANNSCRNFLAVTAACLMVERRKFVEAGGFCEELPVAFNDVELCFHLYELGYHNVCLNNIHAYHCESASRGDDESPEKLRRLLEEKRRLYERHPGLEGRDPYYSVFLNREGLDVRIEPFYRTAGNRAQEVKLLKPETEWSKCRQDECLLVRVEDIRGESIVGWSVVLGDDNACYEKCFLLRRLREKTEEQRTEEQRTEEQRTEEQRTEEQRLEEQRPDEQKLEEYRLEGRRAEGQKLEAQGLEGQRSGKGQERAGKNGEEKSDEEKSDGIVYGIALEGQLRPDLEENMPDQKNVALSGFWLKLSADDLPFGSYRIGVSARNRVTGLRLVNWSNRTIEI